MSQRIAKRLQGEEYYRLKDSLVVTGYSVTSRGNICLYYRGFYKHFLDDQEKENFNPEGLKQFFPGKRKKKLEETQ